MGNTSSSSSRQGAATIAANNIAITSSASSCSKKIKKQKVRKLKFIKGNYLYPDVIASMNYNRVAPEGSIHDIQLGTDFIKPKKIRSHHSNFSIEYSLDRTRTICNLNLVGANDDYINAQSGMATLNVRPPRPLIDIQFYGIADENTEISKKNNKYELRTSSKVTDVFGRKVSTPNHPDGFEFFLLKKNPHIIHTTVNGFFKNGVEKLVLKHRYNPNTRVVKIEYIN